MKKAVMLIALFVGFMGFSQEDEYRKDAMELVKLQTGNQLKAMLNPVQDAIPEENQKAFMEEVQSSLSKLYPSLATIYMESFTHGEIKEILGFYNSPIGKKLLAKMPAVLDKSMEIGRQWAVMELRPMMKKYQTVQSEGQAKE